MKYHYITCHNFKNNFYRDGNEICKQFKDKYEIKIYTIINFLNN